MSGVGTWVALVMAAICGWASAASLLRARSLAKSDRVRAAAIAVEVFAAVWWLVIATFITVGVAS